MSQLSKIGFVTLLVCMFANDSWAQPLAAYAPTIKREIQPPARKLDDIEASSFKFPGLIYQAMGESSQLEEEVKSALFKSDPNIISDSSENAVVHFARGLSLMEDNPSAAAAEFNESKKLLPESSPLASLLSILYGRAALNKQNAKQILVKLKLLSKSSEARSGIWRAEQFSLLLEIMMTLRQDDLLAKTWQDMERQIKPALRDDKLTAKVARYLEQVDLLNRRHLLTVVESMAGEYPHSDTGRWAFQKLLMLQCSARNKYVFPISLLSRLASNTNLDEGLKYFIIETTKGPVRDNLGHIKTLDENERISYLFQIRFWNEARRVVEEQVEILKHAQSAERKNRYSRFLSLLGQLQIKQGEYEAAIKTWSLYVELFGDILDPRFALENIADSLSRLRSNREAAKIYEKLAQSPSSDSILKWHHFWNIYLAGDYREAIRLLDLPGYVPLRDRGMDGGLDYWRARVLEKQRLSSESNAFYKKILAENGGDFYAQATIARHSSLKENSGSDWYSSNKLPKDIPAVSNNDSSKSIFDQNGGAKGSGNIIDTNADDDVSERKQDDPASFNLVLSMKKWGVLQFGRRVHRSLPVVHDRGGTKSWVESFRLATDLRDYAYGQKILRVPESPFKSLPSAMNLIEDHMQQYNADWKLIYPYAFREHVERMCAAADVDPFLLLSLMKAESVFDVDARSYVGARGLMQIMPFTAVRIARMLNDGSFTISDLHRPEVNIGFAAVYLRKLIDYYRGNIWMAVAAYNGGPTSVDRWISYNGHLEMDEFIEAIPFKETRRYVKSVFRNYNNYRNIWQQSTSIVALPKVPSSTTGEEVF